MRVEPIGTLERGMITESFIWSLSHICPVPRGGEPAPGEDVSVAVEGVDHDGDRSALNRNRVDETVHTPSPNLRYERFWRCHRGDHRRRNSRSLLRPRSQRLRSRPHLDRRSADARRKPIRTTARYAATSDPPGCDTMSDARRPPPRLPGPGPAGTALATSCPRHVAVGAAEHRRGDVVAGQRHEHEHEPGHDAGHRERHRHLRNVLTRFAPRSLLASRSAGSSRSSATNNGKIISGR